jgi:hypothetical protein
MPYLEFSRDKTTQAWHLDKSSTARLTTNLVVSVQAIAGMPLIPQ